MNSDNEKGQDLGKQKNRFEPLTGTKLDEWVTSDLINAVGADGKSYLFTNKDTKDYTELTPFDDYLRKNDPQKLERIEAEHEANRSADKRGHGNWHYSCQFCGHGIIDIFKIKNVGRQMKATIGSDCIKGFENVIPANSLFAIRDEKTLRDAMITFKPQISNFIWTDKQNARRIYRDKYDVEKVLPSKQRVKFWILLKELDVNNCSVKKLKDAFRKIDNFDFVEYPEHVREIVHPRTPELKEEPVKEKPKSTPPGYWVHCIDCNIRFHSNDKKEGEDPMLIVHSGHKLEMVIPKRTGLDEFL